MVSPRGRLTIDIFPALSPVIWLGHSSYFVQLGGTRLLIDPVFSSYAAPLPGMVRAFDGTSPYAVQDRPEIDVILITYDHYDHLDYVSMKGLEPKSGLVVTGLGNGAHQAHWGYQPDIAKRYGSFDPAALDTGQYSERWADIHMNPEEASALGRLGRS